MRKIIYKFQKLFLLPEFRKAIVYLRIFYFVKIKKDLKTYESGNAFDVTVSHNLKSLRYCNDRMERLIRPLSGIETVSSASRILVIGPRNENDLFTLFGNGFSWGNITGLDLISYSSKIHLGDMHSIPFESDSFDIILCGWTISYSATPQLAADEILRVAKNKALIGMSVEYSTLTPDDEKHLVGYFIQDVQKLSKRINSTQEILDLFAKSVDHVFFNHDAPKKISHTRDRIVENVSSVITIFSVRKSN